MSTDILEYQQNASAPIVGWEIPKADGTALDLSVGFTFEVKIIVPEATDRVFTTGIAGANTFPNVTWTPPASVFAGLLGLYTIALKATNAGSPRVYYRKLRVYA